MTKSIHFNDANMPWRSYRSDDSGMKIARAVTGEFSKILGAGREVFDDVTDTWTTSYDEVLFMHAGRLILHLKSGEDSSTVALRAGDIVWIPAGTTIDYEAKQGRCEFFYALAPVDWAARQARQEP